MAIPHLSQVSISTPAGTPPLVVTSSDLVSNLNAQYLNGQLGSYYAAASSLASYLPLAGGTLTGELVVNYAAGRQRIIDGANALILGHWDTANVRIEASGRPMYIVSYGGAISIGRSSGSNLVVDTASVSYGGNTVLHAGNYTSYPDATKLPLSGGSMTGYIIGAVSGLWNTYNAGSFTAYGSLTNPAIICFHRPGYFSTNLGLDTDGVIKIGGWSLGGPWPILHSNNFNSYALPLSGGTLTGRLTASYTDGTSGWGSIQIDAAPTSGAAYIRANRATAGTGEVGYAWATGGVNKWINYLNVNSDTLGWYQGSASVMTLTTGGALTAASFSGLGTGLTGTAAGLSIGGTAATATNVAWSGITSKPTTLSGFGITDALPLAGGTLTGALNGTTAAFSGAITQGGNQVLHAGNVATYALPIGGGTLSGALNGTSAGFSSTVVAAGQISANGGLSISGRLYQGVYTRREIVLPGPGTANFGNWKQFIRLWAVTGAGANLFTLKVSVRGTWNYSAVFGTVEACYALYVPADGTIASVRDFKIVHVSGPATDTLRLGDAVIENGFVSIPVGCANTNELYAVVEQWNGSQILGTVTTAVSEALPAFIAPDFRGGLKSDGNTVLHAGNYSSYRGNQLVSPNGGTVVAADSAMPDAANSFIHTLGLGPSGNDGHILGMTWTITHGYGAQIWIDTDPSNRMAFRSRSGAAVWTGWNEIIHSSNYTSYPDTTKLPLAGGTMTGSIQLPAGVSIGLNGGTTYGIGVAGHSGSAVFDTVDSTGSDPLELNYYSGGPVKIGSGANGSKSLYAVGIYDNGNAVLTSASTSAPSLSIGGSAGAVPWSGITSKPTTLSGFGITDAASINGATNQVFNTTALYIYEWIRFKTDTGIYWDTGTYAGWHIYPQALFGMSFRSASTDCGLQLRRNTNVLLGSLYSDGTSIGFLDASNGWGASFTIAGAMNRGSVPGSLVTGNISGSAGSVAWSGITSKPTTLAGYALTDVAYGQAAYQSKSLDTVSTPGLYQYDGAFGGTKPPDNGANYRTVEIGSGSRFSQIAMPWNSENIYFRRITDSTYSAWRTVIHDGNYTAYPDATKLPLAGGTLTGQVQLKAGHGDTRFQLYYNYANDTNHAFAGFLTLWSSEPGITHPNGGIGANINMGGQYYGRAGSGNAYGVYLRFDVVYGRTEFYNTTGVPGTAGGQGTLRAKIESDGEIYATASQYKVLHAGNYNSYALPLSGGTLASTNDQILTLNKSSGSGWGYIGFSQAGTRRFYFGLNASFEPELGVDNGGTFRVNGGMTVGGNAVLTTGNYTSYALPLAGGTLTGALNGTTGAFSGAISGTELTLSGTGIGAYNHLKYGGLRTSGDWQTFTNTEGQINIIEVHNITGGGYTNNPTGVYTYGAVMSWRTNSHSFQLYAAHTGDLAYKTQWGNDNYSGWRRILDSTSYPYAAAMNQSVGTSNSPSFTGLSVINTITGSITGNAGTATSLTNFTNQSGTRFSTDFNSIVTTGFFNAEATPANAPSGFTYAQLISAKGIDTGLQIAGGYTNDNLWFRGWGPSLTFTGWRKLLHDGNYGGYSTFSGIVSSASGGFQTATYAAGRNRIWTFGNADGYGINYYQGAGGISGNDVIGLNFGNATAALAQFQFLASGSLNATGTITATNFSGPGTSLTGTASSLVAGSANAIADGVVSTSAKIAASVVTYAKIQNVSAYTVLGNSSASGVQAPVEISMATLAGMVGSQYTTNIANSYPDRVFMSTDANIKYAPLATAKAHLGLSSKYNNSRPAHTADTNYWVGSMGWGTTDWNAVFDYGSGFTDSWSSPANNPGDTSHHVGVQAVHYTNGSSRYGWQMVNGAATGRWWLRDVWGGGFSSWKEVIHSGNIASQTVAVAGSCTGSAGSVAWTNVSGRPTAVSSFSNDSGYITSGGSISGSSGSCSGNAASVTDGVYLSTNQSISGVKTFSSAPVATNIAKAWVYYNMNNNTIYASYNVSSVTDNGTGVCTVNFSSAMVDANYVVAGTATYGYDDQDIHAMILAVPRRSTAQQAGSCRLATEYIHAAGVYDSVAVRAVFYR